jgi:hypothetical protein
MTRVISPVTACLQTKYTYQALLLAIDAASSANECPPVTCGLSAAAPTAH